MAASVYKGLTIQLGADTSKLSTALRNAQKSAEGTYKELSKVNKALKADPSNVELLTKKQELLNKQLSASKERLDVLKTAMSQLSEEDISSEQWTELVSDITLTEDKIKKLTKQLEDNSKQYKAVISGSKEAGEHLQRLGEKAQSAGKTLKESGEFIQNISGGVSRVGNTLTASVTAPIIAAGAATIKAATDIDSGLTSVKKTVNGTAEQYQELKDAAIEFSKTNAVSADKMLEIDALGAQLGFAIDELELFGKVASGLDIATDMNAETASSEMAQFANITRMAHGDIERYGSAIVNIGNNMATTESKVSATGQRIAAASTQVKMSQADILGWAGAMSSLGVEAEAGGTAFSTTISTIDAAVAKGGKDLDKFAKIAGKSSEEFANSWKTNASSTLQTLLSGVDGAENMTLALEEMGVTGIRQTDVLKRLAGNTTLVSDALKIANDGWNENTALQAEVDNRNASLASKFEILKNKVTAVAEEVGSPLADALMDAVDAAEPLIKIVEDGAEAFSEMSKEEQTNILKNVAMVASLGPLLSIAGKVGGTFGGIVKGVGSATEALGTFTKSLGKAKTGAGSVGTVIGGLKGGLVGLALTAAAAGGALLVTKWMEYEEQLKKTKRAAEDFNDLEKEVNSKLRDKKDSTDKAGKALKTYQGNIKDTIDKINELKDKQIEANDEFKDAFKDALVDTDMLREYKKTIEELGNKDLKLTREEQEKLIQAVDGYNKITGDSVSVIDTQTGRLSKNTDLIRENTAAYIAQIKIEAYQNRIRQAFEQRITAEENLAEANKKLREAQEKLNDIMSHSDEYGSSYAFVVANARAEVDKCKGAVDDAQASIDNCNRIIEEGEQKVTDLRYEYSRTAASLDDWKKKLDSFSDDLKKRFEENGTSTDELAGKFEAAGISSKTMRDVGEESFRKLWEECNGDVNKMIAKLQELDAKQIEPKHARLNYDDYINAYNKITAIRKELEKPLQGKALLSAGSGVGVVKGPFNAAGGISIPRHADGGILNRPTLTSVGWVGEAGAEAIIPLDNPYYSRTFARSIAREINTSSNIDNSKVIQIIVDGAVINDDNAMQQAALDFFVQLQRKGAMNRG